MFYRDVLGGYISCSEDTWHMSPAYIVASAARRLIAEGQNVALPGDYDLNVLNQITWLTGQYLERVKVTERQAGELAQIARTLQDDHATATTPSERDAITELCRIVAAPHNR
ncbi:hypothetical protein ACIA49_38675 [Kribbella sp. NPDC051587]|uniref:hypothetical protein n=1 Tax=Kribbella sp. NPDC051587 TaxID=3364119 RepID=UPI0037A7323B